MIEIQRIFESEAQLFKDLDLLGVFVDNHDVARFLHVQPDMQMFRSALIFSLTVRGIPFFYYGSEQAFAGGRDPRNRESLWQDMGNRDSEIYSLARLLNRARKTHEIWNHPHIEH